MFVVALRIILLIEVLIKWNEDCGNECGSRSINLAHSLILNTAYRVYRNEWEELVLILYFVSVICISKLKSKTFILSKIVRILIFNTFSVIKIKQLYDFRISRTNSKTKVDRTWWQQNVISFEMKKLYH